MHRDPRGNTVRSVCSWARRNKRKNEVNRLKSEILFGSEARLALLKGVDAAADSVCGALGPCGRNAVLSRRIGAPVVSADGSAIVREISLPDAYANMGAQLLKDVAAKVGEAAGDGTTTAVLLARAMLHEGVRHISAGANPVALRRGLQRATEEAERAIRQIARPLRSGEELRRTAAVAADSEEIGRLIAELMERLPYDPVISVEESKSVDTSAEVIEGMPFERGYMTPYMATDQAQQLASLEEPYVLLTDRSIQSIYELKPVLDILIKTGTPLLIVAESVTTEVLAAIVKVRMQQGYLCVCVKAPSLKERMRDLLEDMAVFTGGEVVREVKGIRLEDVTLNRLGRARRVVVTKEKTTIFGGFGQREEIDARVRQIQGELERAEFDFDILKLRERISALTGGVGLLRIGAYSEAERQERVQRAQAAVNAARAARREGVVPGGGSAFIDAAKAVRGLCAQLNGDEQLGAEIVMRALTVPLYQIAQNAGCEGTVVLAAALEKDETGWGFDVTRQTLCRMDDAGILDAAAVCITALRCAASAAAAVVTSEALLAAVQTR